MTNRAEAHGQLILSPVMLPEQLRSSRERNLNPLVEIYQIFVVPRPNSLYFCVFPQKCSFCDLKKSIF